MQKAIFGAGCFWGPEEKFSKITGITKTEVGYCGGNKPQTTYEEVCTGQTNHAEVVKIEFDEKIISYKEIVNFFFKMHNPTTLNRQGPNKGTQYRSEIFFNSKEQKKIAEKIKQDFNKKYNGEIVTNISKEQNYCRAEEYHQKYLEKR
ncbi:MAG TPA: peptide-methionine (S)-S-oxide reductase MsrA [Candidatus Pelagibacter sp.]|nr:peptide-methionine (S)-S-oxide reductase MsrA [Candidatus Pelagibacter sp.]